tara:strand:- start:12977 stop:13840 length:864 start_codon:yes stop_codon:yes gene_type:complete
MKILVTGGSGFLGSHVADELTKKGHKVEIYDIKKSRWLKKGQKFTKGNILDYKKLEKSVKRNRIIYNFAAVSDLNDALNKPIATIDNNILGTVKILELSRKYKIKRFVYSSSLYSISTQGGFYRCSKRAAEDYIEEYQKRFGLDFTILRYGSLYGPRSDIRNGVYQILYDAYYKKKLKYMGHHLSRRKYIHVKDAARSSVKILSKKFKNKYINITGKQYTAVKDLIKIIGKSLGINKKIDFSHKKYLGHYILEPKKYELRNASNFKMNKDIKLKDGIKSYLREFSND